MLADAAPEGGGCNVLRVNSVSIQTRAVAESSDEPRIKGARQSEHIEADIESLDLGDDTL